MRRLFLSSVFSAFAFTAYADDPAKLDVTLPKIENGAAIPAMYAFCQPDAAKKSVDGGNVSPEINWSKGPEGTQSYAVIMSDPDVPVSFADANKDGKTIEENRARKEFVHWVLVDIAGDSTRLPEGADSMGVRKGGKPAQKTKFGVRGMNDYGKYMKGAFAGYDGPCPPWNDARLHHYHFTVYALSVPTLNLKPGMDVKAVRRAMAGKILATGEAVGIYTQNPALAAKAE